MRLQSPTRHTVEDLHPWRLKFNFLLILEGDDRLDQLLDCDTIYRLTFELQLPFLIILGLYLRHAILGHEPVELIRLVLQAFLFVVISLDLLGNRIHEPNPLNLSNH